MTQRKQFVSFCKAQAGKPYIWGAMGPDAYDCSGLVTAGLINVGYQIGKLNTYMLIDMFKSNTVSKSKALPGTLFFYNNNQHVMIVAERWKNGALTLIGARGGDATVKDYEIAAAKGAMVDVCDGDYWFSSFTQAIDPFL